jgi:hypothetical protein
VSKYLSSDWSSYFPCPVFAVESHSCACRSVYPVLSLLLSVSLLLIANHVPFLALSLSVTLVFSDHVIPFLSLVLSVSLGLTDNVVLFLSLLLSFSLVIVN